MDHILLSRINRLISQPRSWWATALVGLFLLLFPILATSLDGAWQQVFNNGIWRPLLMPIVVIFYILTLAPIVDRNQQILLARFRPAVLIDDQQFEDLIHKAGQSRPGAEAAAIAIGVLLSVIFSQPWKLISNPSWLEAYWSLFLALMFGLLGIMIHASINATRLTTALHNQPLRVDIFDISLFEPIGRQSLILAVAFIGGILLGMVLGMDSENIYAWQSWLVYLSLAMVAVVVFFLNMRETHRILSAEKKQHLKIVEERLYAATQSIHANLVEAKALNQLAEEFNALVAYETRLRATRTWPYNTSMMRALFFTILLPALTRLVGYFLF